MNARLLDPCLDQNLSGPEPRLGPDSQAKAQIGAKGDCFFGSVFLVPNNDADEQIDNEIISQGKILILSF